MEIKDGLSAAVLEVLDKDNYVAWSARVKTYLIAQDLWETIEATANLQSKKMMKLLSRLGVTRIPRLYMCSRFRVGRTYCL
jgi:hypothetical protein